MILGLFTGLLSPGGIERIGRHTGAVLASYAKDRGESIRLMSLNDPYGNHYLEVNGIQFSVEGFNRRKIKFILAVVAIAVRVRFAYIGHVNLSPINFLLQIFHCRTVVATHGIEVWGPLLWWRRWALRFASKVTAPSTYTAQRVASRQGSKREAISIIPWGLDPTFTSPDSHKKRQELELPSGKNLLTVGRLAISEREKGIETLIRAFRLVRESYTDVNLIILGDGEDRIRLEKVSEELGLKDQVVFVGNVNDNDLKAYYLNCDIFVLPSKKEGFGLVFIEAMACGKPVIGGKHGGTLDIIMEGETGLLVEYGDISGLGQSLIYLLKDQALRNRLGEAGQRRANELYSFNRFKKELVKLLNELGG